MLAQGNDSLQVDMLLHSDTSLSLFRANFSLLLLLNAACLAEKQQIPILKSLVLTYDLPHSRQARQSLHYWSMRLISWVVLVWRSVLLVEKTGVPGDQRLPGACNRSPGSKLLLITKQLHCGGHLGGRAWLPDTNLEEDHPMTIPSKFGFFFNWATGSRRDGVLC